MDQNVENKYEVCLSCEKLKLKEEMYWDGKNWTCLECIFPIDTFNPIDREKQLTKKLIFQTIADIFKTANK